MNADEILVCEIDAANKRVEVPCPERSGKIVLHAIAFNIEGRVVSSMGFDFKGEEPTGCEKLRKRLREHFTKLYDSKGQLIQEVNLTGYYWDVHTMPMGRGDERAEMVLRGW